MRYLSLRQSSLVLLSIALLLVALTACSSTSLPPGIGRIAFYAHNIYVINSDGTGLMRLAEGVYPAWSPDGQRLAFVGSGSEIYLINADGTDQKRLTHSGNVFYAFSWSLDGRQIAFASPRNGDEIEKIYVLDIEEALRGNRTGSLKQVNQYGVDARDLSWSPDDRYLAFYYREDEHQSFRIGGIDTTATGKVTDVAYSAWSPEWSPDGEQMVFVSGPEENTEIYVMSYAPVAMRQGPEGGSVTRLTNNPDGDGSPTWSPDGKQIAFVSDRDGNWEIYVMNADGSNQTRLTNNSAFDFLPAWSPDGKQIAFVSKRDGNQEIYVMNADGSDQRRLTNTPEDEWNPVWQPR